VLEPHQISPDAPCRLSELVEAGQGWRLRDSLLLIRRLSVLVGDLHQSGRVHRAIDLDHVTVVGPLAPQLSEPPQRRWFGGQHSDPEFCPPELVGANLVEVPSRIVAATDRLAERGSAVSPVRIDVYQLGTLLCRLLLGESAVSYMYSPTAKSRIPRAARSLVDRALGHDAARRLLQCKAFLAEVDEVIREIDPTWQPTESQSTLASTNVRGPSAETPAVTAERATTDAADDLSCRRLGPYRILGRIGSGGMGDVYRGYDDSLERSVAVKVLPPRLARREEFVRRFHTEATAVAKVEHPHVVPIHFIGEDAGRHFFAMQYIEGDSLAQRLERQGRFELDEALEIAERCLEGLRAAHAQGLIHRDVKPSNILLDRTTGGPVLIDFGLARQVDDQAHLTATGTIMGTVDYIAPEQAQGRRVDHRADIYALGVLLYQLLSGRLPYEADSLMSMVFQHTYGEPHPLASAAPETPGPVREIVHRMMAKNPDDRYQTCDAVLDDVRVFREDPLGRFGPSEAGGQTGGAPAAPEDNAKVLLPKALGRLVSPSRWQRVRDWAATMSQRCAPKLVNELQTTTQQVDRAVAEYDGRHQRLEGLVSEARSIAAELSEQARSNREAAARAARRLDSATDEEERNAALAEKEACEESLVALEARHDEQLQQLDDLERQLGQADAALAQLHASRDVLKARLRVAEAGLAHPGRRATPKRRRRSIGAAIVGVATLIGLALLLPSSDPVEIPASDPGKLPSSEAGESETSVSRPLETPGALKMPPGGIALLTFEEDTIVRSSGQTLIQDLSEWGNHFSGAPSLVLVPGKVGSAVSLRDDALKLPRTLLNKRAEYTVTAWVYVAEEGQLLRVYSEQGKKAAGPGHEPIQRMSIAPEACLELYAWNAGTEGHWMASRSPTAALAPRRWNFVAVRLRDGGAGEGQLTIRINGKSYASPFQSVDHERGREAQLGAGPGQIDELAVFDRALSDEEIETLYEMGRGGQPLGP